MYRTITLVLLLGSLVAPPVAGAVPATAYGSSFVDADNDGIYTSGTDVWLVDVIGPDGSSFYADRAYPNWTPRSSAVGVFLRGNLKMPNGLYINADDVVLDGSITGYVDEPISLVAGATLRLADRSKITNVGWIGVFGDTLAEVGDRVKLVSKEYGFIAVTSDTHVRVGEKLTFQTGAKADDSDVYLTSYGTMEVGSGLRSKAAGYSAFEVAVNDGNLVLDRFNFRGLALYLYSGGLPGQAGRITLSNSYLAAKGEGAHVVFTTNEGPDGSWAPDGITLVNTKFSAPYCGFSPPQPPIQGCAEQE